MPLPLLHRLAPLLFLATTTAWAASPRQQATALIGKLQQDHYQAAQQPLDAAIAVVHRERSAQLPGLTGACWQAVEAVGDTADSGLPILLQGDRVTLHHSPAPNHPGIARQGVAPLVQYQQPGRVSAGLITAIATWIHAR